MNMTKSQATAILAEVLAQMGSKAEVGGVRYESRQQQFVFWLYQNDHEVRLVLAGDLMLALRDETEGREEALNRIRDALRQFG